MQAKFFGWMCVAEELTLSDFWILSYISDIASQLLFGCFYNEFQCGLVYPPEMLFISLCLPY